MELPPEHPTANADNTRRLQALQVALDLIDQGFTLMDSELRLVAWNAEFLRLLDFPADMAYVGAPFDSFIRYNALRGEYGPGDPEEQTALRVAAAKALTVHEMERLRPNGTLLSVRGVPVPRHGFITLYSDITDQRRSETQIREQNARLESAVNERTQALQLSNTQLRRALAHNEAIALSLSRSEARIRLITDSIPALVAYFGSDRRYHYVNRGYKEWFGVDPSHPETINAREFLGIETYTLIRPYVMQALQCQPVTFEYEVNTSHGDLRMARTTLIPEKTPEGHFAGCFELTFDITDERLAQSQMARAQKMEALGQLTGGLAHDFNNILTVIQGNLAALTDKPDLKPYVAEYLRPALEAAGRGSELIRGLLTFARKHPLNSQVQDLNECLRSTTSWLRSMLPESIILDTQLPLNPLQVRVDPNQLRDALLNLALNARDATEGRGRIGIRCVQTYLLEPQAQSLRIPTGHYAQICVEDDGCGMDSTTMSRVFEPFFSTKSPGKGSGLGMSMVYGFVQQSRGAIDLRSTPGSGTAISIFLPLASTAVEVAHSSNPMKEAAPTKHDQTPMTRLALLVEDDANVRLWVRRDLLALGYSVIEAESGDEALPLLEHLQDVDLLLSDVVMPGGIDGVTLARHAKQTTIIPHIILMSGFVPNRETPSDIPLLHKPFTRADLRNILEVSR